MPHLGIIHRPYRSRETELERETELATSANDTDSQAEEIPLSVALSALSLSSPAAESSNSVQEVMADIGAISQWDSLLRPLRSGRPTGMTRDRREALTIPCPLEGNRIETLLYSRYQTALSNALSESPDRYVTTPTATDRKLAMLAKELQCWSKEHKKIFQRLQRNFESEDINHPLTASEIVFLTGFTGVVSLVAAGSEVFPSARQYQCAYPVTPANTLLSMLESQLLPPDLLNRLTECELELHGIIQTLTDPDYIEDPNQELYDKQYNYVCTVQEAERALRRVSAAAYNTDPT